MRCDTAVDGEPYGPAQERVDALLDSVDIPTAGRGSAFERPPGAERGAEASKPPASWVTAERCADAVGIYGAASP